MGNLDVKVAGSVLWSVLEKILSIVVQLLVGIIVARMLLPEDYGLMAILTFFTSLGIVFSDSGFSQALLRKASVTAEEIKSVFIFNISASAAIYVLCLCIAPLLARFYVKDVILQIAPVLFLVIPINALSAVQNVILSREFRFALVSKVNFVSNLLSGIISAVMALMGMGVWSLVAQRLVQSALRTLFLWFYAFRRLEGRFQKDNLRKLSSFSIPLMLTDLLSSFFSNIAQLFIGKLYSPHSLGFFNQAQKIKDLPLTASMQSLQSVTFPALAQVQNNEEKFSLSICKVLSVTAYVMFPLMAGMALVAKDMFFVLLGEKWTPSVEYFQILATFSMAYPIAMISYNVMKIKMEGPALLRLEIVKKCIFAIMLCFTIPHSVKAVAWAVALMMLIEMVINLFFVCKKSSVRFSNLFYALVHPLWLTAVMALVLLFTSSFFCTLSPLLRLMLEILLGAVCYFSISILSRCAALDDIVTLIKKLKL
ncbi:MAG: lipopolysaccharide biosynthesis protein [Alistipes sp.]|nr:lipopolysaccharide biosynthesis protein [Candidatus Alistipes equi]